MKQISIFEALYDRYKITKPIRLIELFGGIGSQAKALENLHANFEHYKLVEFDKYPVASYNAIHGTKFVPQDITKIHASDLEIIDRDKYEYIMTYSFPCQDLSLAGKCRGMSKGSGTRSGLLWEVERLLTECGDELPQVLLMENVPQVIGQKNLDDFRDWQLFLENKGYSNYHQILNAKDYGIPQNRQRCFMISILGDAYYEFPEAIPLKLKLKDLLEDKVDEKYYLSQKMINCFLSDGTGRYPRRERFLQNLNGDKEIGRSVTTLAGNRPTDNFVSEYGNRRLNETLDKNTVEDKDFIDCYNKKVKKDVAGTITTRVSESNNAFVAVIGNYSPSGHSAASIVDSEGIAPTVMENHGTVTATNVDSPKCLGGFGKVGSTGQFHQQNRVYDDKVAISVTTGFNPYYKDNLRIRKLTPKECWRLMGFSDEDFDRASKVNSNAQLYKQAGNSIVVNVLMAIFNQLL